MKYTQIWILTYALKQASSQTAALLLRDNRTEFAATVRNCVNKNKLSISFIAHLSSLSHDPFLVELQDVNSPSPVYKAMFHKYFYSYNNSNEDDIYHASLDFPKLKADGFNFHSLDFAIDVLNFDQVSGDTVTISCKWFIEIMNGVD